MRQAVSEMCARLGKDPSLVQGAGGNASWKDASTLWVKASGTWLADAQRKDIFVPVDLAALQGELQQDRFDATPRLASPCDLRPSIETILHGLMPQRVVLHVHSVHALAHLVRKDFLAEMDALTRRGLAWVAVPYAKPGERLARAVASTLKRTPDAQVILLQNHGIVLGADSIGEIEALLASVTTCLRATRRPEPAPPRSPPEAIDFGGQSYTLLPTADFHTLVTDPVLYHRVRHEWALYPDHVVFLGASATCLDHAGEPAQIAPGDGAGPVAVFVRGQGVYARPGINAAQTAQLRCYMDVIRLVPEGAPLHCLSHDDIAELLNWDAEQYRQHLSR